MSSLPLVFIKSVIALLRPHLPHHFRPRPALLREGSESKLVWWMHTCRRCFRSLRPASFCFLSLSLFLFASYFLSNLGFILFFSNNKAAYEYNISIQMAELVTGCESTKPLLKDTFGSTHLRLLEDSNTREILLKLFQQTHCVKNVQYIGEWRCYYFLTTFVLIKFGVD